MAEGEAKGNIFSFDELVSIFSYLSPENLSKCSQVCRDWHEASQVGSLWKRHCLQRWNFCHLGKLKPGRWKYVTFYIKYVICLRTERQGVHKTSFRNVRAFQDRIRILIEKLVFEKKTERMTVFANFMERNSKKCHSALFLSQRISKYSFHQWILSLLIHVADINILRVWHFFSVQ